MEPRSRNSSGPVEAMPKHKQAGHTTVLTKKTANIARKRLQCRSHPHRTFRQSAANDWREPRAAGLKSWLSLMQQQNQPKQSAASQQGKRTFVAGAAKSLEPMTELRTKPSLVIEGRTSGSRRIAIEEAAFRKGHKGSLGTRSEMAL